MRLRNIFVSAILLSASASMFAAEPEMPKSIIHPDWEYTYYNDFFKYSDWYSHPHAVYQKCGFTEEKEMDGHTYRLFTLLTQTEIDGTTKDRNVPLAYMREEDGKVYMRLHPRTPISTEDYTHTDIYGYRGREVMIYDFNLKVGEQYQIGTDDEYPEYGPDRKFYYGPDADDLMKIWAIEIECLYSYLLVWDNGRLSVADIREDERAGRRVWFMHQKCTYPESLDWPVKGSVIMDELDTDFDTTHTRTFRFVEGIGCLKSFLPFPGLYVPAAKSPMPKSDQCGTPYLCEITDKTTGETIYKDERRPDEDYRASVNEIGADSENATPEYYTLQGIRVLNPEPGEICIVRRGAKVTKEVIAR